MRRLWTTVVVMALACLIGLNASAEDKKEQGKKPAKPAEEIFKALDTNGDGAVTLDELTAKRKTPEQKEKAEKMFKAKDKDGDGKLTLEEFKAHGKKEGGKKGKKAEKKECEKAAK